MIDDFEKLKKAVKEMYEHEPFVEFGTGSGPMTAKACLDLIDEFEAGIRQDNITEDEIRLLEGWLIGYLYSCDKLSNNQYNTLVAIVEKIKKLRRVLEGEESSEGER